MFDFFGWFKRRIKETAYDAMEEVAAELEESLGPSPANPAIAGFRERLKALAASPAEQTPEEPAIADTAAESSPDKKPGRRDRRSA